MTKYKIEIHNAITGEEMTPVLFEEQIQEEAKAKSYKLFLERCKSFENGEYTGTLYRKCGIIPSWQPVSAPVLGCMVKDGNSTLTVERVVYGKEQELLNSLLEVHSQLNPIRIQYAGYMHHPNPIQPAGIKIFKDKIVAIFEQLYTDYSPEYLSKEELDTIKGHAEKHYSIIESAYNAYGSNQDNSDYSSTLSAEVGELQLIIQSILGKLNMFAE